MFQQTSPQKAPGKKGSAVCRKRPPPVPKPFGVIRGPSREFFYPNDYCEPLNLSQHRSMFAWRNWFQCHYQNGDVNRDPLGKSHSFCAHFPRMDSALSGHLKRRSKMCSGRRTWTHDVWVKRSWASRWMISRLCRSLLRWLKFLAVLRSQFHRESATQ